MAAEVDHPLFARFAAFIASSEGPVEVDRRRVTLAGMSGRVIAIGSGSGPNFCHFGGCRADRDTGRAIEGAGFRIERNRRFLIRSLSEVPAAPRILGVALRV